MDLVPQAVRPRDPPLTRPEAQSESGSPHTQRRDGLARISVPFGARAGRDRSCVVLDVGIGPEVVSACGAVYAGDAKGLVVDPVFERTEEATDAAELSKSMTSRVCPERRFGNLENALPGSQGQNTVGWTFLGSFAQGWERGEWQR